MTGLPSDPVLARYARCYSELEWSALLIDDEWRLVWASEKLREFMGATDDDLGYGRHVVDALLQEPWISGIAPESLETLFEDGGPYILHDLEQRGVAVRDVVPEAFTPLLEGIEQRKSPEVFRTRFLALDLADPELPPYPVNASAIPIHDPSGRMRGWVVIMFIGVRPNLVSLLARGNEDMYERMAQLVEPLPRQAAILFCDLHASGEISRQIASLSYFRLIRELWTGIDAAVADAKGVIGKHAGDGASAYFLVDHVGSPSAAAAAAIRTARYIHGLSAEVLRDALDTDCVMKVGLHWGGSLYMGQLVPGGRLDISALGDEVNEAARIQEAAGPDATFVSKQLLEQLHPDDAATLGIALEKITYQLVGDIAPQNEKILRDAANLAVTTL